MSFHNAEFDMAAWMGPPVVEAVSLEVEGITQEFNLMLHQDRVGFRLAERDDLWWMTTAILPSGQNVEEFWRQEVADGRFGRTFVGQLAFVNLLKSGREANGDSLEFVEPPMPPAKANPYRGVCRALMCQVIVGEDNRGMAKRLPNGKWLDLPFVPMPRKRKPARGADIPSIWRAGHRFFVLDEQLKQLQWRLVWSEDYEEFRVWREQTVPEIERIVRSLGIIARESSPMKSTRQTDRASVVSFHLADNEVRCSIMRQEFVPPIVTKLLKEHGIPYHWFRPRHDSTLMEGEFAVWPAPVKRVELYINPAQELSHHERLEAYLGVRDWLRGKISEEEISKLLHEGS